MTESPAAHNREGAVASVAGRLLVDGNLVQGALVIERGSDRGCSYRRRRRPLPSPRLDAEIVSPGLVDLQVNGGFGLEVGGDGRALRALAARLPSTGVTTFLPTAVSSGAGGLPGRSAPRWRDARGAAGRAHARAAPGGPAAVAGARGRSPRAARSRARARRSTTCSTTCWRAGAVRAGDAGARAARRARADSPAARGRRGRQPRSHRRDVRADGRRRSTPARRW